MSSTNYIQEGHTAITPYLYAKVELVDFLKQAFGAEITHEPEVDSAGNFYCEATIGGAPIVFGNGYFADPSMAAAVYLYVSDVDATYQRALGLGATPVREPKNESWGDRVGGVKDTSGNTWWIATHQAAK